MSAVVICRPDSRFLRKRYEYCPMDQCTTEMVVRHEGWYGVTTMCCRCGDSWTDGELHERPLRRGWRREAVRRYRRLWDLATHGPDPTALELFPEMSREGS